MKNNLLKIIFVAMMVITISLSGCTEKTDTADTNESASTQPTTTGYTDNVDNGTGDMIEGGNGPDNRSTQDAGQPGGLGEQQMPDLAAAAAELGITEEDLKAALGDPSQGSPDFAAVAAELGVTEEALMEALGVSDSGSPNGGGKPLTNQS